VASLSQSTADTRAAVARMVAKYFIVHLQAEVQKPDEVLLEVFKDLPVRQLNVDMIARVREEFAIPESEPLPALNLFKSWCEINGKFGYEDSGFFGYNRIFAHRLTSLREGTPEAQERHFNAMRKAFDSFDYEKEGFTVAFFLESEHNMRELLRQAAREHLPGNLEADQIVLNQSRAYQVAMYEYFEGVLKATLADNLRLLHGILPQQVASELRRNGHVEPVLFRDAAVIFTDFENFSNLTAYLPPGEVIHRLDTYFSEFDRISAAHGLERIKTIGDSYMAVAGVPESHANPVLAACDTALEILSASQRISAQANDGWNIRIGIHVGPLVAGVIGKQKFSYDVWGATVNFASRMESSGAPGRINVSAVVHDRVEPSYVWEARGAQPIKRLGLAEMFFLLGKKQAESTTRR
jgi:class 3 adenylate cyclase